MQEDLEKEIHEGNFEHEAYAKVFEKEHPRYVGGMGFGVCPSQVLGSSSHSGGSMQFSAIGAPSRAEYDSLKSQLQLLQKQVNFLVSQQGGQLPPGFPANKVNSWFFFTITFSV